MELQQGKKLCNGKYTIVRTLGQGSFGITYLATMKTMVSGSLGTLEGVEINVAIKEFYMSEFNNRSNDGSTVEGTQGTLFQNYIRKFRREAENLSHINHPSIVKVLDLFEENGTTYYAMQYLDGVSLDAYIAQKGHLPENEAVEILKQVGSALQYMHDNNMLHLDVKPNNVMLCPDGHAVLIDFGLSKQYDANGEPESSTTLGLGTRGYAPIEQAGYVQDGTFPATLDVYALGGTLFKMLCGQRPPDASMMLRPETFPVEQFVSLGVSTQTINAMQKAMYPFKEERFQSISQFLNSLTDKGGEDDKTIIQQEDKTSLQNDDKTEIIEKPVDKKDDVLTEPQKQKNSVATSSPQKQQNKTHQILYIIIAAIIVLFFIIFFVVRCSNNGANSVMVEQKEAGYVDLGLPSGTLWKDHNENGFYNYDEAVQKFGSSLPTKEQMEELQNMCEWTWNGNGSNVRGPNGSSIVLPASGDRNCNGSVNGVGSNGVYWSSSPYGSDNAWSLYFYSDEGYVNFNNRCYGFSVRLVQD